MKLSKQPSYKSFGEKAILVEWEAIISQENLTKILSFKDQVSKQITGISELIIGYNSLTILYKNVIEDLSNEIDNLKEIYESLTNNKTTKKCTWEIPVCYDKEFGIDLEFIAKRNNLSISTIIELHTRPLYTVFFIGFLPGFPYLSGLDEALYVDRKTTPELNIKKGAVAIGGKQTGIYTTNSPGGWHVIGNSPLNFFDASKESPCFINAGDHIKFIAITKEEHQAVLLDIESGNFKPKTIVND